jgi:hypothetical protein
VCESGLPYSGNVFDQKVTTGDQSDDSQTNRFGLSLDDSFDSALEPFNLFDGAFAGNLSATDWFEVSHELAAFYTLRA